MSASITPFFTPTSVTGCQLWLDAADSTTQTFSGSSLTAWLDKSPNAYTATSFVNSVAYPSSVQNVKNGNSAIQYTAGNGSSIPNFVLAQTMSIFIVYAPINQSTTSPFLEHGPDENFNSGFYLHAGGGQNFGINAGSGQIYVNYGNTAVSNTWQLIEGINPDPASSSTMAFYVNGQVSASGSTQSGTTTVTRTLFINGRNGANNISYNSYLGELIIFNSALTAFQRQQIESYLGQKWGLTSSLPSGHPGLTTTFYRSPIVTPIKITPYSSVSYAFAPTQITGCQLWLDAQDNSTISLTSGYVSAVTDKALGTSFTSTGSTPANLTVASASINSYQSFYFNNAAGNYVGLHGNLAQLTTGTAIFVMKYLSTQNGPWREIFGWNDNGSTQSIAYGTNLNGGGTAGPYVENIGYNGSATATLTNNGLYIVTFTFTGTTTGVGYNGQISLTAGTVSSYSGSGTSIGICTEASGTQNTNVYLGEIIIYNTVLGSTDRQKVESYLAQKWGLTSSLAATHPGLTTTYYLTQSILSRAAITTPAISAKIPINLSGLIIYYPFDNSLNDFYTLTSLSITGSYSYTTGKKNQCLSLTNTSGVAPTNYLSSSYVLPSIFTVSLWFQTPNTSVGSMVFCAASNVSLVNGSISIYFSGGYLGCAYSDIANNGLAYAISANTWYHAAITYNSGSMLLYVNGSLSGNTVTGTNSKSGFTLGGGRDSGTQYPFTGYIDDFRIYNRILTTTELTAIYNNLG
jgi:hypothetical protein